MAEHVTDKVEYWLYDGVWKGGRPNGSGKLIQIDENYGTYSVNGVITEEGYAIQKAQMDGADAGMMVYSFLETARANGLNPQKYLEYLLETRPNKNMSDGELENMAPWNPKVQECCVNKP